MEKRKNKPKTVERSLWHGTDVSAIVQNYNVSYHLLSVTFFGNAMKTEYPASRGYASPDSNGHKRIYKSQVLNGDFVQGASDIPVPPSKNLIPVSPSTPQLTICPIPLCLLYS